MNSTRFNIFFIKLKKKKKTKESKKSQDLKPIAQCTWSIARKSLGMWVSLQA
jgi:surface antigen